MKHTNIPFLSKSILVKSPSVVNSKRLNSKVDKNP